MKALLVYFFLVCCMAGQARGQQTASIFIPASVKFLALRDSEPMKGKVKKIEEICERVTPADSVNGIPETRNEIERAVFEFSPEGYPLYWMNYAEKRPEFEYTSKDIRYTKTVFFGMVTLEEKTQVEKLKNGYKLTTGKYRNNTLTDVITKVYDLKGRLLSSQEKDKRDGTVYTSTFLYKNQLLVRQQISKNGKEYETIQYFHSGKTGPDSVHKYNGAVLRYKSVYHYNSQGHRTKTTGINTESSGIWEETSTYVYDSQGNWTERRLNKPYAGILLFTRKITYY